MAGSGAMEPLVSENDSKDGTLEKRVALLLSIAQNGSKPPHVRLDALDQLSSVLVSGRRDSELSTAVVTAGWSGSNDMNDDAQYLMEHLDGQLLPVLGEGNSKPESMKYYFSRAGTVHSVYAVYCSL